jgi:uncharacterized protein
MHRYKFLIALFAQIALAAGGAFLAQPARVEGRIAHKPKLLYLTLSADRADGGAPYKHAVVPFSREIVKEIGDKSGEFETTFADDLTPFTAANLANYDAVMFFTTGELPMSDEQKKAFLDFIRSGHGFVGAHSATDTFYLWPGYHDLIGGYFNDGPWGQDQLVTVDVADPSCPIVKFLGKSFQVSDEIYQISDFKADTSHILLKLDLSSVDVKKPGVRPRYYGWPIAWTRTFGKGRIFYTSLGHQQEVWKDSRFQELLLNAIKWATGQIRCSSD